MKLLLHSFTLMLALTSVETSAKVIYGEDNRMEVSEAPEKFQALAKSTATMIPISKLSVDPARPEFTQIQQNSLSDTLLAESGQNNKKPLNFCPGERFVDQPNAGSCSGFLIAPDLLLTAGHCTQNEDFCSGSKWVFDYQIDEQTKQAGVDVPQDNIYSCKKLITGQLSLQLGLDYGMIQLDRPVVGRQPLKLNKGSLNSSAKLVLIGSPVGLPLKVAPGAVVRDSSHPFSFVTNTDSFMGNSGSAIFNEATSEVEGILVDGEEDFVYNPKLDCLESNRCESDKCLGENVSRITSIPEIGLQDALDQAATTGELEMLKEILTLGTWVDFNGVDGKTALIKAAEAGQLEALLMLIDAGADFKHKDARGKNAKYYIKRNNKLSSNAKQSILRLISKRLRKK